MRILLSWSFIFFTRFFIFSKSSFFTRLLQVTCPSSISSSEEYSGDILFCIHFLCSWLLNYHNLEKRGRVTWDIRYKFQLFPDNDSPRVFKLGVELRHVVSEVLYFFLLNTPLTLEAPNLVLGLIRRLMQSHNIGPAYSSPLLNSWLLPRISIWNPDFRLFHIFLPIITCLSFILLRSAIRGVHF